MEHELFELVKARLQLSDAAKVTGAVAPEGVSWPAVPDWTIEDRGKLFFVEIVSRVTPDALARMLLFKELIELEGAPQHAAAEYHFVVAGSSIPYAAEQIATKVGITTVKLPMKPKLSEGSSGSAATVKITTDKSWKVISRLLKEKATSIRQLAISEKVSYGWAHKTIQGLLAQGIATRTNNYVKISDVNKLLNGISWERPFENLRIAEITIDDDSAIRAAKEISQTLKQENVTFAFTSYTAGGLYTGYAVRHDALYLYIAGKEALNLFTELFKSNDKTKRGIKAYMYSPDRDVFTTSRELESIRVTSPAQTLLDLAGLGYAGLDIAKALVTIYATL